MSVVTTPCRRLRGVLTPSILLELVRYEVYPAQNSSGHTRVLAELAMPTATLCDDAPPSLHVFVATLSRRTPKTIAGGLATQPDGSPFRPDQLTVTILQGFFDHLAARGRSPRACAPTLTAITGFCAGLST